MGAKWSDASVPATRRLASSSDVELCERNPASTCTIGMENRQVAARQNSGTVLVSPSSTTASGRPRAEELDRLLEDRADAVGGAPVELPAHVGVEAEVVEERVGERGVVVLAGGDHLGGDAVRPHRGHDGRELDDLGSGAERHEDVHSTINSSK